MGLDHGKHNKIVCDKLNLLTDVNCNDWIVTTAFYSAVHFFDHLLFDFKLSDEVTFKNLDEAHKHFRSQSKHETRGILISRKHSNLYLSYYFLQNECFYARYKNYEVHEKIAALAISKLETIIPHCESKKI